MGEKGKGKKRGIIRLSRRSNRVESNGYSFDDTRNAFTQRPNSRSLANRSLVNRLSIRPAFANSGNSGKRFILQQYRTRRRSDRFAAFQRSDFQPARVFDRFAVSSRPFKSGRGARTFGEVDTDAYRFAYVSLFLRFAVKTPRVS